MRIIASSYTLNKRGTLTFDADDLADNQCGTEKHRIFEYVARIKVPAILDDDGYTVEHNALGSYIAENTSTGSCEQIAKFICDLIWTFFQDNALYLPLKTYVKVYPKSFPVANAFMEYEEEYGYEPAVNPDH